MGLKTEITVAMAQEAFRKAGNATAAAKLLKCSDKLITRRLKEAAPEKGKDVGRDINEFRARHDKNFIVPNKIRDALKKLGKRWEYEVDFIKLSGVSTQDLANFRDGFSDHIVLVEKSKRVWVGTKAAADDIRDMVS